MAIAAIPDKGSSPVQAMGLVVPEVVHQYLVRQVLNDHLLDSS